MFETDPKPHVFAVRIGQDFAQSFVDGLTRRLDGKPADDLARTVIYVNTRRTAIRIHDLLISRGATLLPRVKLITDLARDPLVPLDFPPTASALRRKLLLSQLVTRLLAQNTGTAPQASVFDLTDSLNELLDTFDSEGVPLSQLRNIDVGAHSKHWEYTRNFLEILADFTNDTQNTSAAAQLFAAATTIAARWHTAPPDYPVIVAGSTGSRGATSVFMQAVAGLPHGAVVLPGLDPHIPSKIWTRLARDPALADHSQAGLSKICARLAVDPNEVSDWLLPNTLGNGHYALVSLALTPAPVTFLWRDQGPDLAPDLAGSLANSTLIEAATSKEEATAIALCMRNAVEQNKHSALITPDRDLSRRVAADLVRWGIIPDDSGGEPVHQTPPGIFLRLVSDLFGRTLSPKHLISLAKHPITCSVGGARGRHLSWTRRLEIGLLRGGSAHVNFDDLAAHVADWNDPAALDWIKWLEQICAPLEVCDKRSLEGWVALHQQSAERLAAGPSGTADNGLWDRDAGQIVLNIFNNLRVETDACDLLSDFDYRALHLGILSAESAREAAVAHPLVSIWGTLEARVQGADLVILGGLNEGTWPRRPKADPWMNRAMRAQVGLPSPERQVGLSAHDFQQASAAKEVIWTRSLRDGDAPSVASRWLIRLTNLLDGLGPDGKTALKTLRGRGDAWLKIASALERPTTARATAARPSPQVPRHLKPDTLYVTRIAGLINDPYQIYARFVLGLKPLEPLVPEMDARLRGSVIHSILEDFAKPNAVLTPDGLIDIAKRHLLDHVSHADTREMWLGRIRTLADWITGQEIQRQAEFPDSWQELKGARTLTDLGFTIKAKADRIGQAKDGTLAIFDYKTGAAPGPAKVERYEKQLPLEAAIAQAGGFAPVGGAPVTKLQYISLANGGELKDLTLFKGGASLIEDTWQGLAQLIATYQNDDYGFTARDRPKNIEYPSDYDHLSRYGEWQDTDTPEPEALT